MNDRSAAELHLRALAPGGLAGFAWLDAVAWPQGSGRMVRLFGRAGSRPGPEAADILGGEARSLSGAVMLSREEPVSPYDPPDPAAIRAAAAEPGLLSGRNVLMAFRTVETARTVADWLAYHAQGHAMTGAVILDRSPDRGALAAALRPLMAARGDCAGLVVVLVECPEPLGKPGLGPESHPYLAPDAPGRSRMTPPEPDPWLSPLGEPLVHEAVKARYLTQARAVLTIDVSDLLADPGALPDPFDQCLDAAEGVVLLAGRRIYPWRVREGREAGFGDHVCRQFDARRGIARWGVAPQKAGLDRTWRAIRVASARPDPGRIVGFWRAMALRVPGQKASVLAPKTSLVADPVLVDLSRDRFGARPVLPPLSEARLHPAPNPAAARTTIVTAMKNEGPFILEWLAWHRAIGVSDVLVYTNDCTDGTDRLLDVLQDRGLVQHRANPFRQMPGLPPQHAALQAAESEPVVRDADWIICMDVDEFINVRIGDGRLPGLLAAMGDANMIALTWRMFGNADVAAYEDRFILDQFTLAADEQTRKPHQAWGFKTLFRNIDIYRKLGVHRPKGLKPDLWTEVRWLNGSGRSMPKDILRNGWRSSTGTVGYDWVQLNHYACRSAESFLVKRERGRVNHTTRDQGLNYWFRMNHNSVEDVSIQARLPLLQAEWDRLLAEPAIARAHADCVAAHRTRIAALRARPDQETLYGVLTGERMRRLSRLLRHFGAAVFNAGPQVIPADLHRLALPADFFFTVEHDGDARH